jgi:ubiquinone/menaquinone biosynthesis C-methylase UbiE
MDRPAMLARVLEPEAMDTPEEARDYDAMDHAGVNARFVADFRAAHGRCRGGEVLDVGAGPARIAIALCQAEPAARVRALDMAEAMLELARRNVAGAGLTSRIACVPGDAKALAWPDGAFEAVISNTIVHHIPDPTPALREMARLVAPKGTLFVRDLARPAGNEEVASLVAAYAGAESPAARALFEASLRAALTVDELRTIARSLGRDPAGVTMTSDRHWTWIWQRGH